MLGVSNCELWPSVAEELETQRIEMLYASRAPGPILPRRKTMPDGSTRIGVAKFVAWC